MFGNDAKGGYKAAAMVIMHPFLLASSQVEDGILELRMCREEAKEGHIEKEVIHKP